MGAGIRGCGGAAVARQVVAGRGAPARRTPLWDWLPLGVAAAALAWAFAQTPLPPHDLWWHVRLGQIIAQEGQIPRTNVFSWAVPAATPWVYGAWLGGLLLYWVHEAGGLVLLGWIRNALGMAMLGLVALEAHRRTGSLTLAGVATAVAGMLAVDNAFLRPQILGWLPFTLFLLILGRYADGQLRPMWLGALPAVMLFWVNAHGSFGLGLAIVLSYVVGETLRRVVEPDDALEWRGIGWLAAFALATALATLINPSGLRIWPEYVGGQVANPTVRTFVSEWQPPTAQGAPAFFLVTTLLIAVGAYARRLSPTDLLLVSGFLWLAWSGQRGMIWFGLVAAPVLAQCVGSVRLRFSRGPGAARVVLALAATGAALFAAFAATRSWPPDVSELLHPSSGAIEHLRANPTDRLFTEIGYASYIMWAVPEQRVFVDPRVELFPPSLLADYRRIGGGDGAPALLARYGADRVLLHTVQEQRLSEALAASPDWERAYADRYSEVWRRRLAAAEPG